MKKHNIVTAGLTLSLFLGGCGGGDPVPSAPAEPTPEAVTTPAVMEKEVSYKCRDFEDKYYHFKLKIPAWQRDDYFGTNYYVERDDEDGGPTLLMIAHYNEKQDTESGYDATRFDTAEHALEEIEGKKIDELVVGYYGMTLVDSDYTVTKCEVAGLDAVKYEGAHTFDAFGDEVVYNVTGYCILGKNTPVLFCAIDRSEAQDKLDELSALMDEMAGTFIDGE